MKFSIISFNANFGNSKLLQRNTAYTKSPPPTIKMTPINRMIELQELCELRDLYRNEWPDNCVGFYTVDNFIAWMKREPGMKNLKIFTSQNWRKSGAFVIEDRYQLLVGSLKSSEFGNEEILEILKGLDWSHGYKVSSFTEHNRPAVLEIVETLKLAVEYDSLTLMYYKRCAEVLKMDINIPEGFEVRPLSIADAACIDDLWPNRHQGSLFLIKRLIEWNANMGVYEKKTQELVAWCLRLQGGFLGALQVKDSHKRLGLGSLVARGTSKRIAESLGHDVMALVNAGNAASRGMFDKLGFGVVQNCYWLRTLPTGDSTEWPAGE